MAPPSPAVRRRRLAVLAVAATVVLAVAAIARGSDAPRRHAVSTSTLPAGAIPTTTAARTRPTTVTTTGPTTTTADAGALAQTEVRPTASSAQFGEAMRALWSGVVADSPDTAHAAFFPLSAYLQVKGIGSPGYDYRVRLLRDFDNDLHAAHALLGADAAVARFVRVDVPQQFAHWIHPGVCSARVGYYEVANSRVVYSIRGQIRSFGIASLISWRGEWYVVHFGAILRHSSRGVVQTPAVGPGRSPPSHTC